MVLHLLHDHQPDPIEEEEIRLLASRSKPPLMREWAADNDAQTITHIASGCMFCAYPIPTPLVAGIRMPFASAHEIAVKFAGMKTLAECPAPDAIRELGRQGIEWVKTYTFEAYKR